MKLVSLLCLLLIASCAMRTQYRPHVGNSGGYSDAPLEDSGILLSRFAGNAKTNENDAYLFSQFRAVEVCHEKGFKVAKILGTDNQTQQKNVVQSTSYTYQQPTYYNGFGTSNTNYNAFGSNANYNFNGTFTGGNSFSNGSSWVETLRFPVMDTYYTCENEVKLAMVHLEPVKADDVKKYSNDLLGAIQITKFEKESPNVDKLQVGDIIIKINDKRIVSVADMTLALKINSEKHKALIVRQGVKKNVHIYTKDLTKVFEESNAQVVKSACNIKEIKKRDICIGRGVASK